MATTTSDYYEVLGVDRSASQEDIQRAYRKLARTYHPDVNSDPDAEDRFKRINEANEVLSDPATRARYDRFSPRFGDDWRKVPEDFDPAAAFGSGPSGGSGPFGGSGPSSGSGPSGGSGPFGDGASFGGRRVYFSAGGSDGGPDFEDLLGGLFGGGGAGFFGGGAGGAGGPVAGPDVEAELELSVEDAYAGGRRSLTMRTAAGVRTIDVNIPAGVVDGQRIRLAGQGGEGFGEDAPRGDLYLLVRLAPHARYRVDGRDVTVELPVTPWDAALGATAAVETPGGRVDVKVPAGSSSGRRLRLRGRGLPNPRGSAGDLYAEVRIVVPQRLTSDQRAAWEALAGAHAAADPREAA
ncbi:DnaJ C-terminal domain-containing protein [Cryptosporangium aurantiacum]|uniref:Curved DNA-binding protein n=1 Tax=Cryptosporangium aurantiacum TaxID=134849 RepID=A0A1M7RJI3_9ACTN|nr:DnaJ C-terminal domain-containing protein [Cryptosporangium aurantiacum]SHN46238.1 curved DNA-binding protein [Cryptosporangium aurantiacum]